MTTDARVPVARQKSKQSAIKRPADKALITKLCRKVRERQGRERKIERERESISDCAEP
jgi:hypothetical protein